MPRNDTSQPKSKLGKLPYQLLFLLVMLVPASPIFSQGRKGLDANAQQSSSAAGHTEAAISDLQWRVMLDCALTKVEKQGEALKAADELLASKNEIIDNLEKRDLARLREIGALTEQLESAKRVRVLDQQQLEAKNKRILELENQLKKSKSRSKLGFLSGAAVVALLIALL